jgi:hypothetical protein
MNARRSVYSRRIPLSGGVYVRRTSTVSLAAGAAGREVLSFQLELSITSTVRQLHWRIIEMRISNPYVIRAIARRLRLKTAGSGAKAPAAREAATKTATPWIPGTIGIQGWLPG